MGWPLRSLHAVPGKGKPQNRADGVARRTLEAYARDVHDHFARHAAGVLD